MDIFVIIFPINTGGVNMETCPNCKSKLNIDEKSSGKCFSCGATFESSLPNDKKSRFENNTKNNLCKFLIGLFCISAIICLLIYIGSNEEYTIAKGDVALEKVNSLQSNIWNLNPDVSTSELDKIVLKRNICIGGMVISIIGVIICCIILHSEQNKPIVTEPKNNIQNTNCSIQLKLQKLEQIYKNNLITEEEYENKRKEMLDKL